MLARCLGSSYSNRPPVASQDATRCDVGPCSSRAPAWSSAAGRQQFLGSHPPRHSRGAGAITPHFEGLGRCERGDARGSGVSALDPAFTRLGRDVA